MVHKFTGFRRPKMAGRRIDDHSAWMGSKPHGSVLPHGAKMKEVPSADGAGSLPHYEDTNETIVAQQKMGVSKAHSHKMKEGYRH